MSDITYRRKAKFSYLCEGGHPCESPHELSVCPLAFCVRPVRHIGTGAKRRNEAVARGEKAA